MPRRHLPRAGAIWSPLSRRLQTRADNARSRYCARSAQTPLWQPTVMTAKAQVRIYVAGLALVAAVIVAMAAMEAMRLGFERPGVFAGLTLALVVGQLFPMQLVHAGENESLQLEESVLVAMALLLQPHATVLGFALAIAAGNILQRRAGLKAVFNTAQIVIAAVAAVAVVEAGRGSANVGLRPIAAVIAGALVFFLVNSAAMSGILALVDRQPFLHTFAAELALPLFSWAGNVAIGVLAGLASRADALALPFALAAVVILHVEFRGHITARHDRERLDGLLQTATMAHASVGRHDVEQALAASVSDLLRCGATGIGETPPNGDQIGAPIDLPRGGRRWLVASEPDPDAPFDDAAHRLLEAIAAIGTSAMENAVLFEEVRHERRRLATITSSLGEGVYVLDRAARVVFANPAAERLLGMAEGAMIGGAIHDLVHGQDPADCHHAASCPLALMASIRRSTSRADDTYTRGDGTRFAVAQTCSPVLPGDAVDAVGGSGRAGGGSSSGGDGGVVVTFSDISERKALEAQLADRALHDPLTGLPNRALFDDRLAHAMARARRDETVPAVLFIDLDRYKRVNDSLGHQRGDELLIGVAQRLQGAVRPTDTLARLGGDEFTVLIDAVADADGATTVAQRILDELADPFEIGGVELVITASIGIAIDHPRRASADELLHHADLAMYRAKAAGKNRFAIHQGLPVGRRATRLDMEAALRRALEGGEIVPFFQPIVRSDTGAVAGFEALARWCHPRRGTILPARFVDLAAETGLLPEIDRRMLAQATRAASEWQRSTLGTTVSVNLSSRHVHHDGVIASIRDALDASSLDPSLLVIEITEDVLIAESASTRAVFDELRLLGVRIAVDDFGTGYSSLGYLKHLPLDVLKIDRSFVSGVGSHRIDTAIVRSVLVVGEAAGLAVVAEGVETAEQLATLRDLGCDLLQGFHFSAAVPEAEVEDLLRADRLPARQRSLQPAVGTVPLRG